MKKIFLLLLLCMQLSAFAQQLPLQSQFFLNPYAYNPAAVGANGYTEVFMTHRRQWMGIEGAPVTSRISLHLPTKGKLIYGVNLLNDKRGLLSTTSGVFTVAYRAQLGKDQYLKAGISGGVGMNGIDITRVENPSDPAIANAVNNNKFFDGNAGISYQYKHLTLGVALPKIFSKNMVFTDGFNRLQVKRLDHFLFSASYKFRLSDGAVVIEPNLIYQMAEGLPSQLEAAGVVTLRDVIWFGGAYRQSSGPAAFAGVKISNNLRLGYSYETTPAKAMGFSNASHELTLNMRFGSKKEPKKTATLGSSSAARKELEREKKAFKENNIDAAKLKKVDSEKVEKQLSQLPATTTPATAGQTPAADNSLMQEQPATSNNQSRQGTAVKPNPANNNPASVAPANAKQTDAAKELEREAANPIKKFNGEVASKSEEKIAEQKKENKLELAKGHYVVVSAFRIFDNAYKYHEALSDRFFNCRYGFSSKSLFYYTYVTHTQDINKARFERDKLRKQKGFENTWVLTIE
jgi:type IX secretion system PorP/SprF family membrane protein